MSLSSQQAFQRPAQEIQSPSPVGELKRIMKLLSAYQHSDSARSWGQVVTSYVPLLALIYLMFHTYDHSKFLTFVLSIASSLFVVRIFMIQHDCGHGSFFGSRTLNNLVGRICSFFTLIPYLYWRKQHAIHHATNGNLDHRGCGDMYIFTVDEYLKMSKWEQLKYRLVRNPLTLFTFGPFVLVLVLNRFVENADKLDASERRSVHVTNLILFASYIAIAYLVGWQKFLLIALPMWYLSAGMGIWLFYVQHQFEHTYWEHDENWNFLRSAMQGSSFYKLPELLRWFTSNIGFHHIHHLAPLIPNYKLPTCAAEFPELSEKVPTLTLKSSVETIFLALWDEKQNRLISFREVRQQYQA